MPVKLELGKVRGVIDDAGERAANPDLLTPILESDRNFSRVSAERVGLSFVFTDVEPGRYRLVVVVGENPVLGGELIELAPGQDLDLGTLRTEPGGSILVRVERDAATEGVGPRLFFRTDGMLHGRSVEIGKAAEVLVDNMSAGRYTVGAYGDGMLTLHAEVTVEVGAQAELVLDLSPAVRCPLEITWPENKTLGALTVRIEDAFGETPWNVTETNVSFLTRPYSRSLQLPLGRYTVTAESKTGLRGTGQFEVANLDPEQPVVRVEMR